MRHAIRFEGGYERNYPSLAAGASDYEGEDGARHPIADWPSQADGLRVGFMELPGKRFMAVRVCYGDREVLLGHPVRIDPDVHLGGKRFSAEPLVLPDGPAGALVGDIISANPEQRAELVAIREDVRRKL